MRIDSHQHFWQYDAERDTWMTDEMSLMRRDFLPSDLVPELNANGIDGCVAIQAEQSERETMFLLGLADRYQEIRGVVGWTNLSSPDVLSQLQHWSCFENLCGFRHLVESESDDRFLLRPGFCQGIGYLKEFSFTYDILIYPKQLPAAVELVAKFPEQRFVIDHLAKPSVRTGEMKPWAKHIKTLAMSPNVFCKLSGLVTEAKWHHWHASQFVPYFDVVFEAFGTDRLMFGSDWPICLLSGTYRDAKLLIENYARNLPNDECDKIFGLNAIEFYGLKNLSNAALS